MESVVLEPASCQCYTITYLGRLSLGPEEGGPSSSSRLCGVPAERKSLHDEGKMREEGGGLIGDACRSRETADVASLQSLSHARKHQIWRAARCSASRMECSMYPEMTKWMVSIQHMDGDLE